MPSRRRAGSGKRGERLKRRRANAPASPTVSEAWEKLRRATGRVPDQTTSATREVEAIPPGVSSAWEKLRAARDEAGPGLWPDVPPPVDGCTLCEIGADAHLHGATLYEAGKELF